MVDQQGLNVGQFVSTQLVAMLPNGSEVVMTMMDATNRTFWDYPPVYYFTSDSCTGTPLMYVDLLRFGYVSQGTLFYPTGPATSQPYGSSLDNGFCSVGPGQATLAPMASTSVSNLRAPFSVVR